MSSTVHRPDYFSCTQSLLPSKPCDRLQPKSTDSTVCKKCSLSAVFHKLEVRGDERRNPFYYALDLFCALRNFRRLAISEPDSLAGPQRAYQEQLVAALRSIRQVKGLIDSEALLDVAGNMARRFPFRAGEQIRFIIDCDDVYHRLYYTVDLTWRSKRLSTPPPIPKPHVYFATFTCDEAAVNAEMKEYIKDSFSPEYKKVILDSFGLTDRLAPFQDNPLLSLHFSRWRESVCLFRSAVPSSDRTCTTVAALKDACRSEASDGTPSHASMKPRGDPLLPPSVRAWNDAGRTWACHLYAYATPTPEALDVLASYSPLLELGAGTGYWAYALRKRHPNVSLSAYDKSPPACGKDSKVNSYHGRANAWTTVLKGGVETVNRHPRATLFLCYPPPDSDMALQALRQYKGNYVLYCGEYRGDTGTKSFEQLLEQTFTCVRRAVLPNWVDTCYSLTVWQRYDKDKPAGSNAHPLCCASCRDLRTNMYRCRISCSFSVCSESCAAIARSRHIDELAFRYVLCDQFKASDVLVPAIDSTSIDDSTVISKSKKKRDRKRRREEGSPGGEENNDRKKSRVHEKEVEGQPPLILLTSGLFSKLPNKSVSTSV